MNYTESLEYIKSVGWLGSRPGLSRITELCRLLGDPQKELRFIHVAGTNGKGSFCAMTASILRAAGYRVGLYVSPCITRFNDRMSVNGEPVGDELLAELVTLVREKSESMDEPATEFELITAAAFEYFRREKCDVVVLEVGMGGRMDATNIIENPVLSVITGIALDHTAFLGDTVEKVAAEKAGIIKKGCPVHWGGKDEAAKAVIEAKAREMGSEFGEVEYEKLDNIRPSLEGSYFDYDGLCDLHIGLLGLYQPENAASVVAAVRRLGDRGFEISEDALRRGLSETRWPARFERLSTNPTIIYDGSHNPQGMAAAVRSIREIFGGEKVNILTGVLGDKDYRDMVEMLSTVCRKAFTVTPDNSRALSAENYAEVFRACGVPAEALVSIPEGVAAARDEAEKSGVPLVILGTLYMYSDIRAALGI